jgi:hypothetical protein
VRCTSVHKTKTLGRLGGDDRGSLSFPVEPADHQHDRRQPSPDRNFLPLWHCLVSHPASVELNAGPTIMTREALDGIVLKVDPSVGKDGARGTAEQLARDGGPLHPILCVLGHLSAPGPPVT